MQFWIIYHSQQADSKTGAQMPSSGGHSYLPLDHSLPPPAENMMDDTREESNDDGETWYINPGSFPMTKTGLQKFNRNPQKSIPRQQQYLEVIRNHTLSICTEYEQSVVTDEDVAWLHKYDHIVNPPAADSLAKEKRTSSHPAAN